MGNNEYPCPIDFGTQVFPNPADPAAGANKIIALPVNSVYSLKWIKFRLVCDGTVVNRYPGFGTTNILAIQIPIFSTIAVTAGQTMNIFFLCGLNAPAWSVSNYIFVPVPYPMLLEPSDELTTMCINLQAADQISVVWAGLSSWPVIML